MIIRALEKNDLPSIHIINNEREMLPIGSKNPMSRSMN